MGFSMSCPRPRRWLDSLRHRALLRGVASSRRFIPSSGRSTNEGGRLCRANMRAQAAATSLLRTPICPGYAGQVDTRPPRTCSLSSCFEAWAAAVGDHAVDAAAADTIAYRQAIGCDEGACASREAEGRKGRLYQARGRQTARRRGIGTSLDLLKGQEYIRSDARRPAIAVSCSVGPRDCVVKAVKIIQ